jgi:hypothetical protein
MDRRGFRWSSDSERAAHEFLTGSLWSKTGRFGGRPIEEAPPLSKSDKARIAGIVDVLDKFVASDLDLRRKTVSSRSALRRRTGGQFYGNATAPMIPGQGSSNFGYYNQTSFQNPNQPVFQNQNQNQTTGALDRGLGYAAYIPTALALAPTVSPLASTLYSGAGQLASGVYSGAQNLFSSSQPELLAQPPGWFSNFGTRLGSVFGSGNATEAVAASPPQSSGWFSNLRTRLGSVLGNAEPEQPGLFSRAVGAIGSALGSAAGLVTGAYELLKSGISSLWGSFTPLLTSVVSFLGSVSGWAFILVPIAAAGIYLYWRRYAARPEAAADRQAGALIPKVVELKNHVNGLASLVRSPQLQSIPEVQQAVGPATLRYLERLNTFESILNQTPPNLEPANAVEMFAELLTMQSNVEATKQKIRGLIAPQSVAITQANQPPPTNPLNEPPQPAQPVQGTFSAPFPPFIQFAPQFAPQPFMPQSASFPQFSASFASPQFPPTQFVSAQSNPNPTPSPSFASQPPFGVPPTGFGAPPFAGQFGQFSFGINPYGSPAQFYQPSPPPGMGFG